MDKLRASPAEFSNFCIIWSKGINSVPYWSVRPEYTVLASKLVRITPLFRTRKNTDRIRRTG